MNILASLASWRFKSVILRHQSVTHTGVGEQIAGPHGIGLQLVAQLVNVDTHVIRAGIGVPTPHLLQQQPLGDDTTGMAYQYRQQPLLMRA